MEFKHSVLEWTYEDKGNPNTLYAAEQHFCAWGHSITKQIILSFLLKQNEAYLNSDKKTHRISKRRNRPALPPDV